MNIRGRWDTDRNVSLAGFDSLQMAYSETEGHPAEDRETSGRRQRDIRQTSYSETERHLAEDRETSGRHLTQRRHRQGKRPWDFFGNNENHSWTR